MGRKESNQTKTKKSMLGHHRPTSEMPLNGRFVYWIGFILVILAQTPPSHSVKEVDDTTKLSKLCTWSPT